MGTTLTGTTPQDTYDSLIKVTNNGPLSSTARYLSDGLGNDSVLALSTSKVGVAISSPTYPLSVVGDAGLEGNENYLYFHSTYTIGNNARARMRAVGAGGGSGYGGDLRIDTRASNNAWNADAVVINSSGLVGIGTSSPARVLTLKNNTGATNGISFQSSVSTSEIAAIECNQSLDTIDFEMYSTFAGNGVRFLSGFPTVTERARFTANGLTFNGDTAAANALDDYEEGTFTPTVVYSTSGAPTYAVQLGRYTKIGRTVQVQIYLSFNENGAVGNVSIAGLPFTSVNSTSRAIASIFSFGLTGVISSVTGFVNSNATTIALFLNDNAATVLSSTYTDSDQDIYVTVTYEAA